MKPTRWFVPFLLVLTMVPVLTAPASASVVGCQTRHATDRFYAWWGPRMWSYTTFIYWCWGPNGGIYQSSVRHWYSHNVTVAGSLFTWRWVGPNEVLWHQSGHAFYRIHQQGAFCFVASAGTICRYPWTTMVALGGWPWFARTGGDG